MSANFEEALRYALQNGILGGSQRQGTFSWATRVFLDYTVQKTPTPYLVMKHIVAQPLHSHQGACDQIERLYQLTIFDPSQGAAHTSANQLRQWLDGYRGQLGGPGNVFTVGLAFYERQTDCFYDQDVRLHYIAVDFKFIFTDQPA